MMIGVGSSTLISIKFGEEKPKEAQGIFIQSMIIIVISSVISQIIFLLNSVRICRILGANDVVLVGTVEYGNMLAWFAPLAIVGMTLSVIVRNDGNPKTSMHGIVASAITNIILNYIFIYPMGMGLRGAGLATGISQVVNCLVLIPHFLKSKGNLSLKFEGVKLYKQELIRTIQIGFPSFVGEISFGIVDLTFNRVIINIGGEVAVAAFSIVMYVKSLAYMVFHGIGQAMQPIISFNFGAKQYDRVYKTYHLGIRLGIISAIGFTLLGTFFAREVVQLFNRDNLQMIEMAVVGVRYMFYTLAFAACNTCVSSYFQAIGYARISTILTLFRSVLCELFMLLLLSYLMGLTGVWLAFPFSEVLFLLVGIYLMKYKQNVITKIY